MGQLIVRNIEDELIEALKRRAGASGRSAEAEHREILRQALLKRPATDLKSHLLDIPKVGEDEDFRVPRSKSRSVEL